MYATCWTNWVVFRYGLKLAAGCAGSGVPLGWGSYAGQVQPLAMTKPELSGKSCRVIHSWLPPVLEQEVHGSGHAVN